jgi:hypothetical protein
MTDLREGPRYSVFRAFVGHRCRRHQRKRETHTPDYLFHPSLAAQTIADVKDENGVLNPDSWQKTCKTAASLKRLWR